MKRTIPLLITAVSGFVLIVSFFIPLLQVGGEVAAIWFDILASIAFILGGGNLLKLQLQKISDRKPGWGYAAVTLVSFLVMLLCGLLKIGSPPEQTVESYGESFVPYPLADLPPYSVDGEIPDRADDEPLPASVRNQLANGNGQLTFRGWMLPNQKAALIKYEDTLRWKCTVENLESQAHVPQPLTKQLHYYDDQGALAFTGYMTDADRLALTGLLGQSASATTAIDTLFRASRKPTSIDATSRPSTFAIPASAANYVFLNGDSLNVLGPISQSLREDLAQRWCNLPPLKPLTSQQRQELLSQIESRGGPLSDEQRQTFANFFEAEWKPEQLILAINAAGVAPKEPKTACELQAEIQSGNLEPILDKPAPPAVQLNAEQQAVVRSFVETPAVSPEELVTQLRAAGELTEAQADTISEFLLQLPTDADRSRELAFTLLRLGPLTQAQRDLLLEPNHAQFKWRQTVGQLYVAAHQTKYPWSGGYSAQGSPFWWLYEYVFQPLLTTTFALLAFYVASAAFRAFRAKNVEATLLLGTAFIILLGRTFAGYLLTAWIPERFSALRIDQMTVYIMSIFNTAGNRAIMIGIALGIVSTSLQVLLGIDRSYLGSGDD